MTRRNTCAPRCRRIPAAARPTPSSSFRAPTGAGGSRRGISHHREAGAHGTRASPRKAATTAFGRFFAVYGDSRTWTALFYMLLALVTGVFYFTTVVTGLSTSAGLIVLIVGIPFFLLFVGFTRVLALAEGRLVESLLGQRMPRRPLYPAKGVPIFERIKQMLVDRRTWTTMFYFLLMLPLGILYFVIATVGICVSIGLVGGAVAAC